MELKKIWEADLEKAYELQNSFPEDENGFVNRAYGYSYDEFVQYTEACRRHSEGIDLQEGFVPDTVFILVDDEGNYVGIFNLRHYLNEFLANGPGHIGYGISPKYRRKGYATKGLALTLEEAKKLGIEEAYLSCWKENTGSLKAQQKNGAVIYREDDKEYYTRISIKRSWCTVFQMPAYIVKGYVCGRRQFRKKIPGLCRSGRCSCVHTFNHNERGSKVEENSKPLLNTCSLMNVQPIMMDLPYPELRVREQNQAYANLLSIDYCGAVSEMTAITQYINHENRLSCEHCPLTKTILGIAMAEMIHLQKLGELIFLLGGSIDFAARYRGQKPKLWTPEYITMQEEVRKMILSDIDAEKAAVNQYKMHIKMMNDAYVNAVLVRIIRDEEYHIMILQTLLNER